jgi:LacI family transcriptional regulator
VTLRDVAQVAGVSPSTASRVLNGGDQSVSDRLAARVVAVATSLGYVSNQAARALRGRRTGVFLLVSDPRTASIAAMAAGMEAAGRERGVMVSVAAAGGDADAHLFALRTLRSLRPRALVVTSASFAGSASELILPELRQIESDGGTVVFIGEHELDFPSVRFGDLDTGRAVGRFMGALGRRRAAIFTVENHPAFRARTQGFLEGLAEAGIRERDVVVEACELTREAAHAAARRLASADELPGLVLAGNDVLAIGALSGFRAEGVDVPRQVAVSGVDDIPIARDVTPSLTTVSLAFAEAGRAALEMALAPDRPADVHLPGRLVVRDSTPPGRAP